MSLRKTSSRAAIAHAVASIALLSAGQTFASYDPLATTFTLPIIPDPQYYTTVQWKTDQYYTPQMNWIVQNQASKNIPFVFGMGDNVQDGNPYTTNADLSVGTTLSGNILPPESQGYPAQDSSGHPSITVIDPVNQSDYELEWKRTSAAWGVLDSAGIGYYTVIGNHDYFHWDQKTAPSEFEKYLGPSRYIGKPDFGGYSPANTSTTSAVKAYAGLDTYSFFNAGGYKFLNIALQFDPDAGDMAWAQSIINANPGIPTIVDTHDYQNTTGRDAAGNAAVEWSDQQQLPDFHGPVRACEWLAPANFDGRRGEAGLRDPHGLSGRRLWQIARVQPELRQRRRILPLPHIRHGRRHDLCDELFSGCRCWRWKSVPDQLFRHRRERRRIHPQSRLRRAVWSAAAGDGSESFLGSTAHACRDGLGWIGHVGRVGFVELVQVRDGQHAVVERGGCGFGGVRRRGRDDRHIRQCDCESCDARVAGLHDHRRIADPQRRGGD